ncbi:MAG TPA: hypothetical protein VGT02_07195 [Methylomirabilota bacterium]|jgi:hypothetical protein|nr:hypothetical protein [Methylomirabilota bacterium]
MTAQTILRAILVLVAVSHVVLGLLACLAGGGTVTSLIADIYGVKITLTPQLQHLIRIVGAFMIAIGIMAAFAIRDPIKNRAIVDGIGILQIIRAAQRVVFVSQIQEAFAMPPGRLYLQSAFFFALGLVLILLRPKARA